MFIWAAYIDFPIIARCNINNTTTKNTTRISHSKSNIDWNKLWSKHGAIMIRIKKAAKDRRRDPVIDRKVNCCLTPDFALRSYGVGNSNRQMKQLRRIIDHTNPQKTDDMLYIYNRLNPS